MSDQRHSAVFMLRFSNGQEAVLRLKYTPTSNNQGIFELPEEYRHLAVVEFLAIHGELPPEGVKPDVW